MSPWAADACGHPAPATLLTSFILSLPCCPVRKHHLEPELSDVLLTSRVDLGFLLTDEMYNALVAPCCDQPRRRVAGV